jgi:hypothetical protein
VDHRGNPLFAGQALGQQAEGGTVPVRSLPVMAVKPSDPSCRLRDGRSIRTVSALLLQLVQTSAHDVRVEAQKLTKLRHQHMALKRQESMVSVPGTNEDTQLDEHDMQACP